MKADTTEYNVIKYSQNVRWKTLEKTFVKTYAFDTQKDLRLLYTGKAICGILHSFGPAVRPNYIIHIVTKGKGSYHVDGQVYHVKEGQGFLIPPDKRTFYQADRETPWSYYWVAFSGGQAAFYLEGLGLDTKHPTFKLEKIDELVNIVEATFAFEDTSVQSELMLSSLLYQFLSLLQQSKTSTVAVNKSVNPHVQYAIDYIKSNYAADLTVKSLAEALSLNRSYLSTIFKNEMHTTLQQYITEYRLTRAAELLGLSQLRIEDVSEYSGYKDPLVFAKAFKRKFGKTPSQYRKSEQERQKVFDDSTSLVDHE